MNHIEIVKTFLEAILAGEVLVNDTDKEIIHMILNNDEYLVSILKVTTLILSVSPELNSELQNQIMIIKIMILIGGKNND